MLLLATYVSAQPTFINRIPIPPLVDANDTINLQMRVTTHMFNPADTADTLNGGANQPNGIRTYAYNVVGDSTMTILGPTLKWHTNGNTVINLTNLIGVHTTTHWHGAEVPASMDGGPHQGIEPDSTWYVRFTTEDSASTMWYHPHFHNLTVEHVQKGLSGMILVERANDTIGSTLPRTYGVDDIPVILGDLGLVGSADTALYIDTAKGKRPYNLVNGVTNPYVEVPAHVVRLRILNGSTRKGVLFGVSESYGDPFSNPIPFYLIASDGGYLTKPDTLTRNLNGPGERDEIVIDLSGYSPGDTLYLSNLKDSLPDFIVGALNPPPGMGGGRDTTIGNAYLQLRVVHDSNFSNYTPVTSFTPFTHPWTPGLSDTSNVARHRLKRLVMLKDTVSTNPLKIENAFMIDSTTYDMMTINDTVCVDTKEIWAIQNLTAVAHPFHIHKIQFRILDVVDANGDTIDLEANGLNGPKDDVLVFPGWTLRFMGQFDDYPSDIEAMNSYMYHCHILTHEDSIGGGMMHQFVVTDEGPCVPTSVADIESDSPEMVLYGGSNGMLYLRGSSTTLSSFALYNMRGSRVRNLILPTFDGDTPIDVAGLSCGVYLVQWRTDDGVRTGKVVLR